ncbi:MAG: Hsp70 family protein, partial [Candidatus Caldarchaeum sp.]
KKQEAELRNEADAMVYTVEKALKELADKVPADTKKEVEEDVKRLKEALAGKDVQAIKDALERLRKSAQKIGGAVYGQDTAGSGKEHKT